MQSRILNAIRVLVRIGYFIYYSSGIWWCRFGLHCIQHPHAGIGTWRLGYPFYSIYYRIFSDVSIAIAEAPEEQRRKYLP